MEPEVALQLVTLAAVNCCVPPRSRVTVEGDTASFATRVTVALLVPPGPVAVTVSVPVAVMVAGAVYRPADVIEPAVAVHEVTLLALNCCVLLRPTVAVAGETTGAGVAGADDFTGALIELLCQVPGLLT